jgi:hypothetical protein
LTRGQQRAQARWQLLSDAQVILNGSEATLAKEGQLLQARILSPAGADFELASACQEAPLITNTGFRQLIVEHSKSAAKSRVAVLLSTRHVEVEIKPLTSW